MLLKALIVVAALSAVHAKKRREPEPVPEITVANNSMHVSGNEGIFLKADVVDCVAGSDDVYSQRCFPRLQEKISEDLNDFETTVSGMISDDISPMKQQLTDMQTALDALTGTDGQLQRVDGELADVSNDIVSIQDTIAQMNMTLDYLMPTPNVVHDLDVRTGKLRDDLDTLQSTVDTLVTCLQCGSERYCDTSSTPVSCVACKAPCAAGYSTKVECGYNHDRQCEDIDECDADHPQVCSPNAECSNSVGSYSCTCKNGFFGDGKSCSPCRTSCPTGQKKLEDCTSDHDLICADHDECSDPNAHDCDDNAECVDMPAGYRCSCKSGYHGDGFACKPCSACPDGYEAEGECKGPHDTVCKNVDECEDDDPCVAPATCKDTVGSFKCVCPDHYEKISDTECALAYGAETWIGHLSNADPLMATDGGVAIFQKMSSSNDDVFGLKEGKIEVKKHGIVAIDYHQDIIQSSSYATLILKMTTKDGTTKEIARELISHTFGRWDGIYVGGSIEAPEGAVIWAEFASANIVNLDNGIWARISVLWVPIESGAEFVIGRLNNQLSGNVAKFSVAEKSQQLTAIDVSSGEFTFKKHGLVRFDYIQDIKHNCGYFYGQAVRIRPSSTTLVTRELMAYTPSYWDSQHLGGTVEVAAGDTLRFDMYRSRCTTSVDNGVWGPVSVTWYPMSQKRGPFNMIASLNNRCSGECRFSMREATDSDVLGLMDGRIIARRDGHLVVDYHQDLIHGCTYSYMTLNRIRDGSATSLIRELQAHTEGRWDGINISGTLDVKAFDQIQITLSCISSIDNGDWGMINVSLFPDSSL